MSTGNPLVEYKETCPSETGFSEIASNLQATLHAPQPMTKIFNNLNNFHWRQNENSIVITVFMAFATKCAGIGINNRDLLSYFITVYKFCIKKC